MLDLKENEMARGRKIHVWSAARSKFLLDHAATVKDADLAEIMSKKFGYRFSTAAIRFRRRALGVQKKNGRGKCEIRD